MERVPLFSDAVDATLENTSVSEDICADIRSVRDYIFDLYGGPYAVSYTHLTLPTNREV